MSTPMWDVPEHLMIPVDVDGNGPVDDADAHHLACWCGEGLCRGELRAAADRIDQLEQQLAALHTAIGDPNELRRAAVSVGRDRKVTNAEAERRILALTRLAAAVEHTQEGT